jgi:pimeloyl-ACP methyl ester carboxylesterase
MRDTNSSVFSGLGAIRRGTVVALVALVGPLGCGPSPDELRCVSRKVPVALGDNLPITAEIFGELCYRGEELPKTVQLLVHGGSYHHRYWRWPYKPERYSYVDETTRAGYATFAIDRLGIGESTRPPSDQVNLDSQIATIHQVIQALRRGDIAHHRFRNVQYVGHSIGAILGWAEIAKYQDVDAVIISGEPHLQSELATQIALANVYPANLDPKFAPLNLDDGYLTTVPGSRGLIYYNLAHTDPNVLEVDELLKQTFTATELQTILPLVPTMISRQIQVPVLTALGSRDNFGCQPDTIVCTLENVRAHESAFYSPEACLTVAVFPEMGHDMNTDLSAPAWFRTAVRWSDEFLGPDGRGPRRHSCETDQAATAAAKTSP